MPRRWHWKNWDTKNCSITPFPPLAIGKNSHFSRVELINTLCPSLIFSVKSSTLYMKYKIFMLLCLKKYTKLCGNRNTKVNMGHVTKRFGPLPPKEYVNFLMSWKKWIILNPLPPVCSNVTFWAIFLKASLSKIYIFIN